MQFMQRQPEREENWRAWLCVVAEREAWAIERKLRREIPKGDELGLSTWSRNIVVENPIELFDDVDDALSGIAPLPRRLRQVTLLRAFGFDREDIGEVTGDSVTRVDHLIRRANSLIGDILAERIHAERPSSPRAGGNPSGSAISTAQAAETSIWAKFVSAFRASIAQPLKCSHGLHSH